MKRTYPLINDITTTPDAPPDFLTKRLEYPQKFAAVQRQAYPDLHPLKLNLPASKAYEIAKHVAETMKNWKLVQLNPERRMIQAVSITPLMRFRDDIIIEIRTENDASFVHMRSKSRLGRGDFGANAKRIRLFMAETEKAVR